MLARVKRMSLKFHGPLIFLIGLILILSTIYSIYFGLWHIMSINIMLLLLIFAPRIMKRSYKIKFPKEFEILLLLFVISTFFIGTIIKGAIVPIFFGIAVSFIGFIILLILYSNNKIEKDPGLIILIVICFSITFGFSVEIAKYLLKLVFNLSITGGEYTYMMRNMLFVILGSVIASAFGLKYMEKEKGGMQKVVEKFRKNNPKLFPIKKSNLSEIKKIIRKGENEKIEFKSTLRSNLYTNEFDKRMENSVLKTIAAFLNSEGGKLYIGVSDKGKIIGIEKDKFQNEDKFFLHLSNIIKQKIGKNSLRLIKTNLVVIENKKIAEIICEKSDKETFLKDDKKDEFYIRSGPASTPLSGKDLIDYIETHFR